jgi:CapZ-interacting protein
MSILDDAIREHLELKRAHGADEADVKKLEDEAFGPPQRPEEPDPFAEAPTEFMTAPESAVDEAVLEEGGRRAPNIGDLQEAPEASQPQESAPAEAPQDEPADKPDDGPAEEEHPAMEHEAIADTGHSTEERHAIASQPTEMFDVESQFDEAPPEAPAPADEELVDAEQSEPSIAPPVEEEPADEFDEFFSEQRLSDELNQALEAPLPEESGEFEVVEADDQGEHEDDEPPPPAAPDEPTLSPAAEQDEPATESAEHEDVLEDTPEFLEESPEDDDLWFEQKPPKDIDFGD